MGSIADLYASVRADMSLFDKDLQKGLTKSADTAGKSFSQRFKASLSGSGLKDGVMQGLGIGAGLGTAVLAAKGVAMVTDAIGGAIDAASNLAESQAKVDQVFTDSADSIHAWAAGSAQDFGLSSQAALEAAGTFGNFIQALGNTEAEANTMSRSLVELAADLASFNNMDINEVIVSLRSGLSGEAEPMRRLGVSISATRVEANILAKGIARTRAEITDAMKVAERYAIIMEDTTKAQGDFDRTSDGLANTQRRLNAELENLSAKLGSILIGPATGFVEFLSSVATVIGGGPNGVTARVDTLLESMEALREEAEKGAEAGKEMADAWTALTRDDVDPLARLDAGDRIDEFVKLANILRLTREELNELILGARERGGLDVLSESLNKAVAAYDPLASAAQNLAVQQGNLSSASDDASESTDAAAASAKALASRQQAARDAAEAHTEALREQAEVAAEQLATAIEAVADTSFPDLRDAAKEAAKAIRKAFKDERDPIKQLEKEHRTLNMQRRKAMREGRFDIVAMIDARREEVAEQIRQRQIVNQHYRDERKEQRERQADLAAIAKKYDVSRAKAVELWKAAGKDAKMVLNVNDSELDSAISKLNLIRIKASQRNTITFGSNAPHPGGWDGDPSTPWPRAFGGAVRAGVPYVVGEQRPEVFVPDQNGRIEPDAQTFGGVTVPLSVYGLPMQATTPTEVVQQVRRAARMGWLSPARRTGWAG